MTVMGIVSTGTWFPETYVTAEEIAAQSGMPEWVVREKLGIERKFVADPEVHPNDMAVKAARKAIDKAGIDPMDIDVVLCTTEEWREYLLWTTAIDLAYRVGAKRAWGLDIHTRCATTIAALKMARSLMADDPAINTILIGGGYAVSHFIDFTDVNTSFLFNIGAGAGAMIVKRDWPENRVLGDHLIADGVMSRHVIVPASGTVRHPTDAAVAEGGYKFRLVKPEAMKARLGEVSIKNWLECVDVSLEKSGSKSDGTPYTRADIGSSRNARAPGAEREAKRLYLRHRAHR
jgi:3-oxoacyl-[acyl-carrier-protein] synthase-3